jgi:Ankyrin repeats (many copies)
MTVKIGYFPYFALLCFVGAGSLAAQPVTTKPVVCTNLGASIFPYVATPTKLHAAILAYDVSAVRKLASIKTTNVPDINGQTSLFLAVVAERPHDGVKANMMPMDQRNSKMKIYRAQQAKKQLEIVRILLASNSDITHRDLARQTSLHVALARPYLHLQDVDLVSLLIKAKADVNAQDGFGQTPLMLAARGRKTDVAKLLLARGAAPELRRCDGKSALDLARESKSPELIAALTR